MTKPTAPPVSSEFPAAAERPADPQILCYVSVDGGMTWSAQPSKSLGAVGVYRKRVKWHRLGSAENVVLKFAVSDPVPLAVLDCQIEAEGAVS